MSKKIVMTGGAGFIGSNLVRRIIESTDFHVVNVDKLTYAGNLESLADVAQPDRYVFEQVDIVDRESIRRVFQQHQPDWVMNLAAESHVDRSIDKPDTFIQTNIVGTFNLLSEARRFYRQLDADRQSRFRFHHISTDEVYGSLEPDDPAFSETTRYDPHSPYSASKAASDHLVRAWRDTYGLPTLITNSSNNYGPFQFPEKLIPVVILNAIHGRTIPVYGSGEHVRDWLYVEDHADALLLALQQGQPGETYNIGGDYELKNIQLVRLLCSILDELLPASENERIEADQRATLKSYSDLIQFVADRPGHDMRYAIDATKIKQELGWQPLVQPNTGFRKTVQWYLHNEQWWQRILTGNYRMERQGLEA